MVSHLEHVRQKWAYEASIRFLSCFLYEKLSTPRVRRIKLKSLFLQNNTGDDIPLQAHRGETSLYRIGDELVGIFQVIFFLVQLVSFTVDGDPL